jgi:hypothetical protein
MTQGLRRRGLGRRALWSGGCLLVATVAGLAVVTGQTAYASHVDGPRVVFTIGSPQITESSSLAMSTVHPGLVYTTNDSGDDGTVYTLDSSTGRVVGRTTLAGADPLDVEAIAAADDGTLVIADIGDNAADHSSADLYRIDQPGRGAQSATPDRVDLTYPGGARDAEGVLFDASNGRAFVVSKLLGGARVYATPPNVFDHETARLRPVAPAPLLATDATFLPGDAFAVIRTYSNATVYAYPSWKEVATFDLPSQPQGESITAPASGDVVWVGSEGVRSRVLAVDLPELSSESDSTSAPATSSPGGGPGDGQGATPSSSADSADTDSSADMAQVVFVVSSAALLALLAGLVIFAFTRRHH